MADDIHETIEALVAEEHALWEAEASGNATQADRDRLAKIKVDLDRYWDLLRRRRAVESSGGNPEAVELRSEETVENYLQ
jgi:uncharacterized protein DUF2630